MESSLSITSISDPMITAAHQEGPRPLSTSALPEASSDLKLSEGRRKRSLSISKSNESIVSSLSAPAAFSCSLDKESGLGEPIFASTTKSFSATLGSPSTLQFPQKNISETKSVKSKDQTSPRSSMLSTPSIKLKPRQPRRNGAGSRMDESRMKMSSFQDPPPKIFIPFLPTRSFRQSRTSQEKKQPLPLPPHPLLPTILPLESSSSTPPPSKFASIGTSMEQDARVSSPPRRSKKTKRARSASVDSAPLSSPPQLIPTFDFGMAPTSRDEIMTPPIYAARPPAPLTTPPSIITKTPPLLHYSSGESHVPPPKPRPGYKTVGGKRVAAIQVVAKPIARRPLITPSNRINQGSSSGSSSACFSMENDACTPLRTFSSHSGAPASAPATALSSSMESSAFSFSSGIIPQTTSSLLSYSTAIGRTLSADDDG